MTRRHKKKQRSNHFRFWSQRLKGLFLDTRVAIFTIALAFIAINHLGVINWTLDFLGRGFIADANAAYLHESKLRVGESILVLTGLDTSLEVLKSSSAGFSFFVKIDVQIGNIVATLQELANKALMISLVAAGSLIGLELVLKLAEILTVPALSVTIITMAAHYVTRNHWHWAAYISGQISQTLVLITLVTHIGLPMVVYVSSLASATLTSPLAQQAHNQFVDTHLDFSTVKQEYKEDKEGGEDKGKDDSKKYKKIRPHVDAVINKYKTTASNKTHKQTRSFSGSVVRHAVAVLFDSYIFPALLLITFIWASRVVINRSLKIEELIEGSEFVSTGSVPSAKRNTKVHKRVRR